MASAIRDRVYLDSYTDGKQDFKWVSGDTKSKFYDAIVKTYVRHGMINRILAELSLPSLEDSPKGKVILFRDYKDKWLASLTNRPKPVKDTTLGGYKSYLTHLVEEFGDTSIFEITPFDIQQYFSEKSSQLTLKTLREHHQVLKQIFDYAMDDDDVELPRNPAKNKNIIVNYSEKDSVIREPLPSDIINEIINAIHDLPDDQRRLMALYLFTGMRRGEVLGLRWEDIDFEDRFIHVRRNATYAKNDAKITTTKTENGVRSLPLYAELTELLHPIKKSGYIIGDKQTPITAMAYRWMFTKIKDAVEIHGATAHVFRHSYLTMLDEAGVDPKTLQYIAGHGNFSFTMNRYVHGRKQAAQEAGGKYENLLDRKRHKDVGKGRDGGEESETLRDTTERYENVESA